TTRGPQLFALDSHRQNNKCAIIVAPSGFGRQLWYRSVPNCVFASGTHHSTRHAARACEDGHAHGGTLLHASEATRPGVLTTMSPPFERPALRRTHLPRLLARSPRRSRPGRCIRAACEGCLRQIFPRSGQARLL